MGIFSKIKLSQVLKPAPVSDKFGFDRGTPIDRFYIEKFLKKNEDKIKGDVLEVAENTYTLKFGSDVKNSMILNGQKETAVSVSGDLTNKSSLPYTAADCFICTQTFNFIYDFNAAIEGTHHILRSGGTLLATVACLAPISQYDAERWGDYWRFTPQSAKRAVSAVFGDDNTVIYPLGNSAAAALFIKGFALEEIQSLTDLEANDVNFPLIIGITATKWV